MILRGATVVLSCAIALVCAAQLDAADRELQFEDSFQRESLGDDWWSTGLACIEDGRNIISADTDRRDKGMHFHEPDSR